MGTCRFVGLKFVPMLGRGKLHSFFIFIQARFLPEPPYGKSLLLYYGLFFPRCRQRLEYRPRSFTFGSPFPSVPPRFVSRENTKVDGDASVLIFSHRDFV